jgi:hypothetical protein
MLSIVVFWKTFFELFPAVLEKVSGAISTYNNITPYLPFGGVRVTW